MMTIQKTTNGWNPRYMAYCHAHGETDADKMLARDDERWPGGRMCGFILWTQARWSEWRRLMGYGPHDPIDDYDHRTFDLWLWGGVHSGVFPREGHA